jgi:hypothetical protein
MTKGDPMTFVGLARATHPGGEQLEVGPACRSDRDPFAVKHHVTHG